MKRKTKAIKKHTTSRIAVKYLLLINILIIASCSSKTPNNQELAALYPPDKDCLEICSAVRKKWHQYKVPYAVYYLKKQNSWAIFEGIPVAILKAPDQKALSAMSDSFSTGSSVIRAVLRNSGGKWRVRKSWYGDDVASASEFLGVRAKGIPVEIVDDYITSRSFP